MICPKCGSNNIEGSSFCIKCGINLKTIQQNNTNINDMPIQNQQPVNNQLNQAVQQPIYNNQQQNNFQMNINNQSNVNTSAEALNYFMYAVNVLLKPFKTFKEEESKLCNTKTSLIFSAIVAVMMMIAALIKSMITAVFSKTIDFSTYEYKTSVDFSKLKDLDWLSLIGKNLLIFIGVIVAIAGVYYIMCLIFKKTSNFIKILSISASSLIPYTILGLIISPILSKIWMPLSIITMIIGVVYSLLIFINLMDDTVTFDKIDTKIFFHLICLAILGSIGYYLYTKLMVSNVPNNINDLLDMFG